MSINLETSQKASRSSEGRFDLPSSDQTLSFLDSLNPPQREAATHVLGPLIVLAGAGSGKTKMLISRMVYLMLGAHVPGHQILAVTFTNKAAREMKERVGRVLDQFGSSAVFSEWNRPEIGTFHSICVRILRREMDRLPFNKPFVIYDDSDQLSLIKGAVSKLGIDEKAFTPKSFQFKINRLKCDAVSPDEIEPRMHDLFEKNLKRVYELYQKDLFANNAIDFGEIICLTYRLLRDHADIREKYQRRFSFVHVDEYQDTNRAQYLLLSMLCSQRNGGHGNICVVGDEDQSIYKWRGADIRNILDFESDYPSAHVVKLEQNYRSSRTIIEAASQVIRNNTQRKDKTLWTENEEGHKIQRLLLPDERAEADLVISEIKRIATSDSRSYHEFAILYRTHAQSRQFEDAFRREKIPYQVVGGLRFYDRKEIKDVLSYFKAIQNPSDSVSLKRVLNVPARGIGATTLEKIDAFWNERQAPEPEFTFWEALVETGKGQGPVAGAAAKKVGSFTQIMAKLMKEQPSLMLSELYHLLLDETGYILQLRAENTEESLARIENLEELDTLLTEFEEDFTSGLPAEITEEERKAKYAELLPLFLEQSSLATEGDQNKDQAVSAVAMMTLHSSKGLEYPVVFLPGMEEGLFPSIRPWEDTPDEEIEEERRLCYVGMTRARERLYLTHVAVRRLWGQVHYQEPARFFQEMPDEAIEFRDFSYGNRATQFRQGSSRQFGVPQETGRRYEASPEFSQVEDSAASWKGTRVAHPTYGEGKVVSVEGSGEDAKVMIEFRGGDRRKFIARFAKEWLGGE